MIKKWLSKNEAAIVDREGKSDIWKLFGAVEREEKVISNFVACKACKKFYAFKPMQRWNSIAAVEVVRFLYRGCGYTRTRRYTRPDHWYESTTGNGPTGIPVGRVG